MPIIETDPLCGQSHPIKLSAGQKEYYYCSVSHSTVWLTSPITRERILGNGGVPIRENPSGSSVDYDDEPLPTRPRTIQERRAMRGRRIRANPSEDEGIETRRTFPCPECGTPVPEDSPRCPGCDEEIRWESGPTRSEKKLDVIERAIAEERERLIARGIDPDTGESMR